MSTVIFNSIFLRFLPDAAKTLIATLLSAFTLLTGGIDMISKDQRPPEVSRQNIVMVGAAARSQGVANDGEGYIFSSRWGLLRTGLDGVTREAVNAFAIPKELKDKYGLAHIGGISCYGGRVYAGVEDSKVWKSPVIMVFDAKTLKYDGSFYLLDPAIHTRGLPWVAVDTNGILCAADHSINATTLYFYDTKQNMKPVGSIALTETVERIQGADFYDGILYAATNNATQAIYAIHPQTGAVKKCFDRNLTKGSEGEGLTALKTPNGAVLHALDMGPLFINANFRHYALPDVRF